MDSRSGANRRLLRGMSLVTGSRVVFAVCGIVTLTILTRLTDEVSLGSYFILLQFARVASIFCKCGSDLSSQRFLGEAYESAPGLVRPLVGRYLAFVSLCTAATLIAIFPFWDWATGTALSADQLTPLMGLSFAVVGLLTLEQVFSAFFRAGDHMLEASLVDGVIRQGLMMLGVAAVLVSGAELDLRSLLLIWCIGGTIEFGAAVVWLWKRLPARAPEQAPEAGLSELVRVSYPMAVSNGMAVLRGSVDVLIVGSMIGPAAAGLYAPIQRISKLVVFIWEPAAKVLSPMVAPIYQKNRMDDLEDICRRAATYGSLITVPLTIFFFVKGDWVLRIAFGERYGQSGILLAILTAGLCIRALMGMSPTVLQLTGHERVVARINIVITVLTIVCMLMAAQPFGLIGIVFVQSGLWAAHSLALGGLTCRLVGIRPYVGPIW